MNKSFKTLLHIIIIILSFSNYVKAKETKVPYIKLSNEVEIPQLGLGTYRLAEGDEAYNSVLTALKNGYRHIDTAHAYQNERSVGRAIKDSGIPRKEIWLTSKLWPNEYGKEKTLKAIERMKKRLGVDYIDLVYFHQPVGDYIGGWSEMEEALKNGSVRAIGISNFDADEKIFNEMLKSAKVKPQIMQMEMHPFAQRKDWQKIAKKNNIQIESWFPLGGRDSNGAILKDKTIQEIAKNHKKTPAQIILRWHIQEGFVVIPGSSNSEHIKENIEIFDFELTDKEIQRIRSIDKEKRFFNMPLEEQRKWFSQFNPKD